MLLDCQKIGKAYNGPPVLSGVDFSVKRGEIHALVGENGAGKSTLIKIITGVTNRDKGEIFYDGKRIGMNHSKSSAQDLGIAVIYQELSLIPGMTVAQNIFLTKEPLFPGLRILDKKKMNQMAQQLINHYGFELRASSIIDTLSIAQRQTIEILKALNSKASLVIMDEPTSSLSSTESAQLFDIIRRLREEGIAVLYISHRMEEVYNLSDRVSVLRDGCLVAVLDKDQILPERIIQLMIGRKLDERDNLHAMKKPSGSVTLHIKDLTSSGKFENINIKLCAGEVLGIGGLVGSGRTELLRAIYGIDGYDSGAIEFLGTSWMPSVLASIRGGFGFIPEERRLQGIMGGISITGNIGISNLDSIGKLGFVNDKKELGLASKVIELLKIKPPDRTIPVGNLSGGNQQKVVVGKWLIRNLRVLIVDEPTVGIDIGTKEEMYQTFSRLAEVGVAILLVSSDLTELVRVSDRILVLRKGKIIRQFDEGKVTEEDILRAASGLSS